jgi:hypothetical protein
MAKSLFIKTSEVRDGMRVIWVGDDEDPKQFAVAFEGEHVNIHRQSIVESIVLALELVGGEVDKWEKQGKD